MTRKQKKMLWRILGGTAVFILSLFLPLKGLARLAVFLIPYAIAALVYWVFCLGIEFILNRAEKKMDYYHD